MRATRLVSLVVPLLVVPGLAAAQSRYFTYERGINRPGHAYRFLETHNAADCSLACQAANSCRAWTYVKPGAPRRAGTASRCWLKHVVPQPIRNDCCTSGVRKRSASHVDHAASRHSLSNADRLSRPLAGLGPELKCSAWWSRLADAACLP